MEKVIMCTIAFYAVRPMTEEESRQDPEHGCVCWLRSGFVLGKSEEDARAWALNRNYEMHPTSEGYVGHQATAARIEDSCVLRLADVALGNMTMEEGLAEAELEKLM